MQSDKDTVLEERPQKQGRREDGHRILISESQPYLFDIDEYFFKIEKYYEQKIIKETISKSLKRTLLRKNLISEEEYREKEAIEEGLKLSKGYIDRIQIWANDSLIDSKALKAWEEHKARKVAKRKAKVQSIIQLIDKIAIKMRDRQIDDMKSTFNERIEQKKLFIPKSEEYMKAVAGLSSLRERVADTKNYLTNFEQF